MVNEIVFGAVCAASDADNFASYIKAQGGANTSRIRRTLHVAEELNAYDEEVNQMVGIFAPHLGESDVFETRLTQ